MNKDVFRLRLLLVLHFILFIVNTLAIPVLMTMPVYLYLIFPSIYSLIIGIAIATPLISFIIRLAGDWNKCPLTTLENKYRTRLGMTKLKGFTGPYILRPLRNWRNRLCSKRS